MPLFSRIRAPTQGDSSVVEEHPSLCSLHRLPAPPQLHVPDLPPPVPDIIPLSQHYSQIARVIRPFMPPTCRWLGPENVELIGSHPIAAGGSANIWEAVHEGRKVIFKSYRCYVIFDVVRTAWTYCNEVRISNLLHHEAVGVVAFVGAYSTDAHPLALVYEYMDGLDLKQYLKNEPYVRRLKLLADISQDLSRMHDLGIVHGGLKTTNVLVDKDGAPHLSGLGNVHILPNSTAWTMGGRINTYAPGSTVPGMSPGGTGTTHPTKANDMYAFGVMAFEVLTGHRPFFELIEPAAAYSMLKGDRPHRPNHHEISDTIWYMVEQCWHNVPSQRMSIGEVVRLLEAELKHAYDC